MAKGNLFLGQARGKVGSVVFSRAMGNQITRTKPTSVRNPKTVGQNTQRAILATIAKAAATMTSLVDHSFANVKYGADSVRHFRKINMGILRNLYLNTQNDANLVAKGGSFIPSAFKISEGSLTAFSTVVDDSDVGFMMEAGSPLPTDSDVTVADFLASYPGIQGGDQITLVLIRRQNEGSMMDGDAIFSMSLNRIVFAPNAFDDPNAILIPSSTGYFEPNLLDLTKTTDKECINLVPAHGAIGLTVDENVYYAALILSRKVNGKWQRSAQYLDPVQFNDHTNNESAIASYGANASINNDTEYLNQADESEVISGESGAYMNVTTAVGSAAPDVEKVNAGATSSNTATAAGGTIYHISGQAFAPAGKRVVTVELDRPDGSYAAHGATSVNYQVAIAAGTAGKWTLSALFDDGTRAIYEVTLSVQA